MGHGDGGRGARFVGAELSAEGGAGPDGSSFSAAAKKAEAEDCIEESEVARGR